MEPRGSGWTVVRMQVKHLPRSWHTQGESTRLLLPWGHPGLSGLTVVGEGHVPHPALPCCVPAVSHTRERHMLSGQRVPHQWHTWRAPRDQTAQHAWV